MRILLSLIALSCAIAMVLVCQSPSANASAADQRMFIRSKSEQTSVVEKAYYRRGYYRRGYYHRRYYGGYYHRGYGYWLSSPLLVALRSSHLPLVMRSQPV